MRNVDLPMLAPLVGTEQLQKTGASSGSVGKRRLE
jgi:hypothetical protein